MLVPDRRAREGWNAELDQRDNVGRLMDVIGGVVPVDMAGQAFVGLAVLMGMPMCRDLGGEFRMPDGFGLCDSVGVMPGRDMSRRQRHAQRHRKRDDEAGQGSDAAEQHDEQIVAEFLMEL